MLYIEESYLDLDCTDNVTYYSKSGVYETRFDKVGPLYRGLLKEFGRCTGKVYDTSGAARQVGWVFLKRVKYEDSPETFLREVWVTMHASPPDRTVTHHYQFLD